MAKEIIIKTKEGLQHVFALKEIILKGELLAKYPSGAKVSLCPTQYAYGESYIDKLPDALLNGAAAALIPVETDAEDTADESPAETETPTESQNESAGAVE